jgi:hypothetical protein
MRSKSSPSPIVKATAKPVFHSPDVPSTQNWCSVAITIGSLDSPPAISPSHSKLVFSPQLSTHSGQLQCSQADMHLHCRSSMSAISRATGASFSLLWAASAIAAPNSPRWSSSGAAPALNALTTSAIASPVDLQCGDESLLTVGSCHQQVRPSASHSQVTSLSTNTMFPAKAKVVLLAPAATRPAEIVKSRAVSVNT